ncbi:TPA: phage late control D family protein [Escherichia coli]|nr:phage late control D family protein [Escherichia coli]HBA9519656.1 phage late control D family protein [Escherichia coli]HBA9548895.1 phage late control D family protein [Escherichia coli]HBA9557034.1 phage late control D family protein [Escherichia coli]
MTGYGIPAAAFRIVVDGRDVTKKAQSRLISLSLTDNREAEADTLELVLDDADGGLDLPRRGAQVHLSIGWQGETLIPKGTYTVDEITHSGAPDQLTITARSADFRASLNIRREQSWHNITLADLAKTIATRNKLNVRVQPGLAQLKISHSDQADESDASYLTRTGKEYGFSFSVKNGALILISAGSGKTAGDRPLPTVTINRSSGDRHQFTIADRDAYTGVIAHYINHHRAAREKIHIRRRHRVQEKDPGKLTGNRHQGDYLIGSDENVLVLRHTYASAGNAKRAARNAWERLQRGAATFSITLAIGQPELTPEYPVKIRGFKPAINAADWTIKSVTHEIGDSGLITTLEMEVSADEVNMV